MSGSPATAHGASGRDEDDPGDADHRAGPSTQEAAEAAEEAPDNPDAESAPGSPTSPEGPPVQR